MDDDIESDGEDVDSFDEGFEDDVGEFEAVDDAEDIAVSEDTDTFAEDIMETDPSEDSFDNTAESDIPETGDDYDIESQDLEERDFTSDMLEDGSEEIDALSDGDNFSDLGEDTIPEDYSDLPDSQEFESMLDEGAKDLAGEDYTFDNEDLGDYEDMGDFDYLDDVELDADEADSLTDADVSPDSMAEDIGEIAEEVGEIAEEGEAIIAALL